MPFAMDSFFRYPLNKAHFNQRQAEAKERTCQFAAALEFRKDALTSLTEVLEISNDVVKNNIKLQISHEKRQIQLLKKKIVELTNFLKCLEDHQMKMAQAKVNSTIAKEDQTVISPSSVPSLKPPNNQAYELFLNCEYINTIIFDVVSKIENSETDKSGEIKVVNKVPSSKHSSRETIQNVSSKDVVTLISELKKFNNRNLILSKKLKKDISSLQLENSALISKVEELERRLDKLTKEDNCSLSPVISFPGGDTFTSPELSIPEFAPLDCPPLDFLNITSKEAKPC